MDISDKLIAHINKVIDELPLADKGKKYLEFQVLIDIFDSYHQIDPEKGLEEKNITYGIQTIDQAKRYYKVFVANLKKSRFFALQKYSSNLRGKLNPEASLEKVLQQKDKVYEEEIKDKLLGEEIKDLEWHSSLKLFLKKEENFLKSIKLFDNYTSLTSKIINSISILQGLNKAIKGDEVSRSIVLTHILHSQLRNWRCTDESKWGKSETGKSLGELDITIEDETGSKKSIIECFQLNKGMNRKSIETHFQKIFTYDAGGLQNNYLITFSEYEHLDKLWNSYLDQVKSVDFPFKTLGYHQIPNQEIGSAGIKIIKQIYIRSGCELNLYHIMVDLKT